jgi:two-component system response regulator FixJ
MAAGKAAEGLIMSDGYSPVVAIVHPNQAVRDAQMGRFARAGWVFEPFATASSFLEAASRRPFACAVIDVALPEMTEMALLRHLRQLLPNLQVIVTAQHGVVAMAVQALHLGAADFIENPGKSQRLVEAVQKALEVEAARRETRSLIDTFIQRLTKLSPRERAVMDQMVIGRPTRDIGAHLGISPRTVSVYRAWIMAKMGFEKLPQLVCAAMAAKKVGGYQLVAEAPPTTNDGPPDSACA